MLYHKQIDSPVGPLTLVANDEGLARLSWGRHFDGADCSHHILEQTETQLREYFAGTRRTFSIPLAANGTEFQMDAWQELQKIPFGRHITYGQQATNMGRPKSTRAVGSANGKNPVGIIIPCHRVIGANGDLTGFAGGLAIKKFLLDHEARLL